MFLTPRLRVDRQVPFAMSKPYAKPEASPGWRWLHQTVPLSRPIPNEQVAHIAVFDNEAPKSVSLYFTDAERKRFEPILTVATDEPADFHAVMQAWSETAPFLDLRIVKTVPLLLGTDATDKTVTMDYQDRPVPDGFERVVDFMDVAHYDDALFLEYAKSNPYFSALLESSAYQTARAREALFNTEHFENSGLALEWNAFVVTARA